MSEIPSEPERIDPSLSELEADLAGIAPTLSHFNRDAVLYHSGQRTAERNYRRSARRWQGVCGILASMMLVQTAWVWQLSGDPAAPLVAPAPEESAPDLRATMPVESLVEDATPSPTTTPPKASPTNDPRPSETAVAAQGRAIRDEWFVVAPAVGRSRWTALGAGLRNGSSLRELETEPGFIPRSPLSGDGSPTTPFSFPNPRTVQ